MATIQFGGGELYDQVTLGFYEPLPGEMPDKAVILIKTPQGDAQKNFPVSLTLEHDEALTLAAMICKSLVTPQPYRATRVEFGEEL